MPESLERTVEQRLRAAVESAPSGLLMTDATGTIVLVNAEIERMFGYSREEMLGRPVELLIPERFRETHPATRAGFTAAPRARAMGAGRDLFGRRKDGSEVPVEIGLNPIVTGEGLFVLGSVVDISTRKRAEEERSRLESQLQQSQRMVAVGTLAGGVAHDFNNILGAIVGLAELVRDRHAADAETVSDLDELLAAALRGRQVIERILRFSRRQETVRKLIDLETPVREAVQLLRSTLPTTIDVRIEVAGQAQRVLADSTSVHQILTNLGTNAAHAMPEGGQLEITLDTAYVRDSMARSHPELREGPHARVVVRDTGMGMPPEVASRAFEPFFTTKPPGSGSGLGLAMVRSLMREHDGGVEIQSNPGSGTVVTCWFPAAAGESASEENASLALLPRGNGQHILVVDDEASLARVGARRLESLGYKVTAVTSAARALELARDPAARFDLLLTDFTMPAMTGLKLARLIHEARPGLPMLIVTGSAGDIPPQIARESHVMAVLQKPLTMPEMAAAVHAALNPAG